MAVLRAFDVIEHFHVWVEFLNYYWKLHFDCSSSPAVLI
jgi:hypothetical protein